jgi:hypothetical protein
MDGMKPPRLPEQPVEVVRPEHLARLLKACEGRDFTTTDGPGHRRDQAIYDTRRQGSHAVHA